VIPESVAPPIERKRFLNVFPLIEQARSYDEQPIILAHIDPQLYLSRNSVAQPFFLICEKDTVLTAMSGDADVEFRDCSVLRHRLATGDYVYVPAGTPHRIVPREPSLHLRFKAREAGLEAVSWYCDACGAARHRIEWDTAHELPQEAYARACREYDETIAGTPCATCGDRARALELGDIRWEAVAAGLGRTDVLHATGS
jgi:hypothetical protein